jgi:hypothetical protein
MLVSFFIYFKINFTKNTGDKESQKGPTKWCQISTKSSNSITDSQLPPSQPSTESPTRTVTMTTITDLTTNDSNQRTQFVILDCAAMSYVDASGADALRDIAAEIKANIQAEVCIFLLLI